MSYRILTKNAVENTNIDGARDHNFNAGRRSGIVQGALNSGNLFLSANNTIALDTCELRLCGHRVVIDSAEYKTFYNQPSVPIRYSLVAQIIVSNNGESVSFDLKTQLSTIPLVQNDLDKNINGTYELEIGRFTQLTDGTLTDVVRTADLITGGGNNDSEYIRIGTVTTNKISPELDADVDIENTINPDDNKPQTNFTFNLPTSVGTVVSVNGEEKTSINTDITPIASSENLITSGGVHDYPAVTFAESERQKSKNLLLVVDSSANKYDYTMTCKDGVFTINGGNGSDESTFILSGTGGVKAAPTKYYQSIMLDNTNSIKLSAGTYTISATIPSTQMGIIYGDLGTTSQSGASSRNLGANITLTFTKTTYVCVYRYLTGSVMNNVSLGSLQLEEGSVATDYQPYHGQITHNGDAPVVFAESEKNRAINLFNYKTQTGTSEVTNNQDGSFTISNLTFYYPSLLLNIALKPNTKYTFAETVLEVSDSVGLEASNVAFGVVVYYTDGTYSSTPEIPIRGTGRYNGTFTTNNKTINYVEYRMLRKNNSTSILNGKVTDISVCEGDNTVYYPYEGSIVHEEQLDDYVTIDTEQTITGTKTYTQGLIVSGRPYNSGDDEGIIITKASNNYAGLCLGSPTGARSVHYLMPDNSAVWRWSNGSSSYDISHPQKAGTIALTSDIPSDIITGSTAYREFATLLPKNGTVINNGADLNSIDYLKVGNYYQSVSASTSNMTNIPQKEAFMMTVYAPLSSTYDDESTNMWCYRTRCFMTLAGDRWWQFCNSNGTAGVWNYGPWHREIHGNGGEITGTLTISGSINLIV